MCSLLGCPEGRSAAGWIDYNLFGHQIVCHRVKGYNASATANAVDGDPVPVPHFGLALSVPQFQELADRVTAAKVKFVIQPHLRFKGRLMHIAEDNLISSNHHVTLCIGSSISHRYIDNCTCCLLLD